MRTKKIPLSDWKGSSLETSTQRVPLAELRAQPVLPGIIEAYRSLITEVLQGSAAQLTEIGIDKHGNVLAHATGLMDSSSNEALAVQMAADLSVIASGIDLTTEQAVVIGIRLQDNFRILDARIAGVFESADAAIRQKKNGLDSRNKRRDSDRREREENDRLIIEAAKRLGLAPGAPLARQQWKQICTSLARPTTDANRKAVERAIKRHIVNR